jgi:putative oxidoreductase
MVQRTLTNRLPRARRFPMGTSLARGIGATAWRYAPVPLRLVFGIGFLLHGWPKLFAGGHAGFAQMLGGLGIPAPEVSAWLIGGLEVVGGIALLAGALVGLFSVLLMIEMIVAAWFVHLPSGFLATRIVGMGPDGPIFGMPGYEVKESNAW